MDRINPPSPRQAKCKHIKLICYQFSFQEMYALSWGLEFTIKLDCTWNKFHQKRKKYKQLAKKKNNGFLYIKKSWQTWPKELQQMSFRQVFTIRYLVGRFIGSMFPLAPHTAAPCKIHNFKKERMSWLEPIIVLTFTDGKEEGLFTIQEQCTVKYLWNYG